MTSLVFDIEADSLSPTKIHCIAVRHHETSENRLYGPTELSQALDHLSRADVLYGHNIVNFDLPAIKRLLGWEPKTTQKIRDSLLWSQFLFSDLASNDRKRRWDDDDSDEDLAELLGKHSLEAWGKRLNCHKAEFNGPWDTYTQEMGDYCLQDTLTNLTLVRYLMNQNRTDETALQIEHDFARICLRMEQRGIRFDVDKAKALNANLTAQLDNLVKDILVDIPPTMETMKKPAFYVVKWPDGSEEQFDTKGIADAVRKQRKIKPRECSITPGPLRVKEHAFNPGSRDQVRELLWNRYQWLSPALTDKGEELAGSMDNQELARQYGKLSEEILRECPHALGQKFADYYLIKKIASFLSSREGKAGWLSLVEDDAIHGRIITIGAATFRCTHSRPNLSQTPHTSIGKDKQPVFGLAGRFGADCRQLFTARDGFVMVGADLSGIEAVMLAHYLYPYDNGAFAAKVVAGDIHTANVKAIADAGFVIPRSDVKTALYAYLYSAGDMKLGHILATTSTDGQAAYAEKRNFFVRRPDQNKATVWSYALKERRKATPEEAALIWLGSLVRSALERGIDGMVRLNEALKVASKRNYLNVFDRQVPIRNARAALNTLLQCSAALVMKKWTCLTDEACQRDGIEYFPLLNIHDENDAEVREQFVKPYSDRCLTAMRLAGEYYRIRLPVTGEVKSGKNWLEVH